MNKKIAAIALALTLTVTMCGLAACGGGGDDSGKGGGTKTYSLNFNEQVSSWTKKTANNVTYYAAEVVRYCTNPTAPAKQCLNIYVPEAYLNADGSVNENGVCGDYTGATAPVLYINSVGSYNGFSPYKLNSTTTTAGQHYWYYNYLKQGYVVVFAGSRGRSDYLSSSQTADGKAPVALADLKAGIRFIRHNAQYLPGDMDKIISNGMSAGGAMSTLIAVSGNSTEFDSYLQEMGAVMNEKDDVYAAQIYCPITDLDHADFAYEWMFNQDNKSLSDFQKALSTAFRGEYITYFNSRNITVDGTLYQLGADGRSGTYYNWLLEQYAKSYRTANGANAQLPAYLSSLDNIVANHNSRSKTCPSFDGLEVSSTATATAECGVFGKLGAGLNDADFQRHFSTGVASVIASLQTSFPTEYAKYYDSYYTQSNLADVKKQVELYNPYTYLDAGNTDVAEKIRICVGSKDSDTSIAISSQLALTFMSLGIGTSYEIMWDFGHTDADTEGAYETWVDSISK